MSTQQKNIQSLCQVLHHLGLAQRLDITSCHSPCGSLSCRHTIFLRPDELVSTSGPLCLTCSSPDSQVTCSLIVVTSFQIAFLTAFTNFFYSLACYSALFFLWYLSVPEIILHMCLLVCLLHQNINGSIKANEPFSQNCSLPIRKMSVVSIHHIELL